MMFVLYYAFKFAQEAKSAVIRSLSSSMNYPSFFFLHIFLWQTCKRKEKNSLQFSWQSRPVLLADSPAYQQTLEAEKSTLEAIKPPLTAVLLTLFQFRGFSKYGCKQQEACLYIFHCPLSAATLSRVFHRFLPFPADTQVISRDFLLFFGCFNLLKHGWRTDSKMSGGISQPAARIMLPTSSLRSIHQVVAYYAFSPNFLVKVQRKLKKKHVQTCSLQKDQTSFSLTVSKKTIHLTFFSDINGWENSPCLALPNALPSFLEPLACSTWIAWIPKLAKLIICDFTTCSRYSVPKIYVWIPSPKLKLLEKWGLFGFFLVFFPSCSSRTVGLSFVQDQKPCLNNFKSCVRCAARA